VLGSAGVIVGTAVQLVDAQGSQRWLWITLVVVGAVVAVPALVLQSPWWTERQRRRIERAHHDRGRQIDERHFLTYGRGVVRPDWRGSYFTGRTAAIRALVGFLDGDPAVGGGRIRAVVGGPGSGKSAVVGRLVILANLDMRRGERDVGSAVPTVGVIDGAIHARGKDVTQILGGLAECAGFGGNWIDGVGPHVAGVDELILALRGRRPPVTVVLDAVDEAVEPERVVREVIGPLTDSSPDVGIRLVLGVRPHLLRLLALPGAAVIDLDDERYFEPTDVVEYALACMLLSTDPLAESPYRADVKYARRVAEAIADRAGRVFLIAQLTGRALAHDNTMVDLVTSPVRNPFPASVGAAMDGQLARLPEGARIRELLVPLAFAEGAGLPPGPVWAELASALGTAAYSEQDVRWLIGSTPAVDLVQRLNVSDRDVRYRLFHEALAEHLATRAAHPSPHTAVTEALLAAVPRTSSGDRDWRSAHRYIRDHLPTHAARSGHLDELLADPEFLLTAGPDQLLRELSRVRDPQARRSAAVYRGIVHELRTSDAGEGAALLELHARQQGHSTLADRVVALNADQPWSAPWVRGRPVHPHQVIGRHHGEVGAIAVAEIDGQIWVVTGDSKGTVGIWDLERGIPVGAPVAVPAGEISAVAVTHLPRTGPVVVFGGDAGLWRLRLADRDLGPLVTDTGVRAVVVARARDQVLVVWGDGEGRIGIHDLATGAYCRQPFDAHSGGVEALTTTEIDRATVIVSGGADGTATAWTLPEGTLVARMAMVSAQPVVTVAPHGPHSGTVTAGGLDGVLSAWNLTTRRPVSDRVLGYDGWLSCLSITSDRPAAVGGAYDGRVLVWSDASPTGSDPASGVDYPDLVMAGHDGWVTAVAVAHYAERDVVVSGGLDGTVRAWSVDETAVPAGDGDAHDGELTSLTLLAGLTDQVVVVSGGTDGTVRLWRTADGKPADDPILAHEHGVRAVTATVLSGRPTIASGGLDGTVRVWDATTRQPVGGQFQAHSQVVRAAQLLLVEGRPVLVTGGDGGVRRWNPLTGHSSGAALAPDRDIRALTFTVVDRRPVLVAGTDHGIYRWDLLTGEQIGSVLAAGEQFDAVAAIVAGGVAMVFGGGDEPDLRCWTMTSGSAVTLASITSYRVRSLTVARTGNRPTLVVGDDHGVSTVSVGSGGQLRRVRLGFGATALAAETSSSLLIGSRRGLYHVTLAEGE
jgi:WD40 repeat protein